MTGFVEVPLPLLTEKLTLPVGRAFVTLAPFVSTPVSVTVTVQLPVAWFRLRTVCGQVSVVVVTWPASTVVVPVSVSRLKNPLQTPAPLPGTQSFTLELVLWLARVSVWRPMSAPVGLNAASGNDASIDALPPLLHGLKLQLC